MSLSRRGLGRDEYHSFTGATNVFGMPRVTGLSASSATTFAGSAGSGFHKCFDALYWLCSVEGSRLTRWAIRVAVAMATLFMSEAIVGVARAQSLPEAPVSTVVNRYCIGCHNSKVKAGNFVPDSILTAPVGQHSEEWEKVVRKLRVRHMPPLGLPRPDEQTYEAVVGSLAAQLDGAAAAHPNPGRTDTFRRLNRTEYQNAIRDLLALDIDATSILPGDEAGYCFDNVTVGNLSPTLLESYLQAAQRVSTIALGVVGKSPGGDLQTLPPDLTQEQQFEDQPLGTHGGMIMQYTFPQDADYDITVRLQRDRNEHVEGIAGSNDVEVMLDGERVRFVTVRPPGPGNDHSGIDKDLNFRLAVKAGPHVVSATLPKKASSVLESGRQPYMAHFNMDRHPRLTPAIYSISIVGPYNAIGPGDTPSRRRILVCKPTGPGDEEPCARKIFAALTRRAYRRTITDADLRAPLKFYKQGRIAGSFDEGIDMGLRAVLVSPEFLFRIEQDPNGVAPNTAYKISDVELASRLSFFLWSSIPDDELLDLAIQNKLRTPGVLEKQVRRMLADERSRTLVTNFADQWLYLRNLSSANPDMRIFAGFDDNLRQAFRRETELFLGDIFRHDRSVLDLLSAKYTYLNERLAKHYGIPNVYGARFRRVDLDENSHRGGLLRQGSILTVTSYADRTSPVIRGKWHPEADGSARRGESCLDADSAAEAALLPSGTHATSNSAYLSAAKSKWTVPGYAFFSSRLSTSTRERWPAAKASATTPSGLTGRCGTFRGRSSDYYLGTTVDQLAAQQIGKDTRLPSLELSMDLMTMVGQCDNGYACVYQNNLSWASPTTPLPSEAHPRKVFERLFGDGGTAADRLAEMRKNASLLDWMQSDIARLQRKLGPGDRVKVSEYLDSVREVERQKAEAASADSHLPDLDRPVGVPAKYSDHAKLMIDLQVLAWQADVTRVIVFQLARETSNRAYTEIGIGEGHHPLTHNAGNPKMLIKCAEINKFHMSLFAYYLEKLKATPDGDGNLLDHSLLLYGSGMCDADKHDHTNLPIVVAGGKPTAGGRYVKYREITPMANLHLTLLDRAGVRLDSFADSTGKLIELEEPAAL